jgi:DnaJ-domain-containing protein 1
MSLSRRLRRLLRAHLGSLRGDPLDDPLDPSLGARDSSSSNTGASGPASSNTATADAASSEVPPDVAEAYRALEVPVGSDRETVKKGYRRMMKKYHQDRFENDDEKREIAGTVSKRINKAYERLIEYLDESPS